MKNPCHETPWWLPRYRKALQGVVDSYERCLNRAGPLTGDDVKKQWICCINTAKFAMDMADRFSRQENLGNASPWLLA